MTPEAYRAMQRPWKPFRWVAGVPKQDIRGRIVWKNRSPDEGEYSHLMLPCECIVDEIIRNMMKESKNEKP